MNSEETLLEIVLHIKNRHPEIAGLIRADEHNSLSCLSDLGHRFTSHYKKNYACELARLCDVYGSDKGELRSSNHPYPWKSHSYTDFYSRLWSHCRAGVKQVFECGIGTNNPDLASSMGSKGMPGASLRVWRDYFNNAEIFGADIDKSILFAEERITTYYIDQLNPKAIAEYWSRVPCESFDFMIDDGLHTFEAGSTLFAHSIHKLASHGIYVIEDVSQSDFGKYRGFFGSLDYVVEYVALYRPNKTLGNNNLVVVRKR